MTIATISQIAAALGISDRAVRKRARDWQPTGERVQGGGDTYDIDTLQLRSGEVRKIKTYLAPKGAKVIPLHRQDEAAAAAEKERQRQESRAHSLELFGRMPADKQRPAQARLEIIKESAAYIARNRLARTAGQDLFCHEYNLGRVDIAPWVREEIPQLAPATLRAWISKEHDLGMMGLVDMYGNRKGQSKIETDENLKNTLVGLIIDKPHIKPCHANESLRALCPDSPWVSDKSVERYMIRWKKEHAQEYLLATNPDAFKNKYQAAFGSRSEHISGPNQLWEIDATPADLLLVDGRHKIIGICDVGTRRLLLQVSKTEKSVDNTHVVRRCLLNWGVPRGGTLVTDNGTPYKADHFTRVMRDLEIYQHFCKPFSGDEKPHIERGFRTFSHDLVELLPGYIGHSVADRKAIEARKSFARRLMDKSETIEISMTAEQLQVFCDRWTASYHNREHSSLGRSPNQALAQWPQPIHRIADERALDVLLAEAPKRRGKLPTVQKNGINLDKGWYIHADLIPYIGQQVRVLYDPADLGRIMVYAINDNDLLEFVCIAEDPNRTGISRAEVAAVARARQSLHKAEMNRHAREAKKALKGVDIVQAVLEHREQEAAKRDEKISYLPRHTVDYTTPALEAAGQARAALAGEFKPTAPAIDPAVQAMKERMKTEQQQARAAGVASIQVESAKAKYKRMKTLQEKLENDEDISVEEFAELRSYKQTNEYRALKGMEEEAQRAVK